MEKNSVKHRLKRIYERYGFKVSLPMEEGSNYPIGVRDLDGNRITQADPRWAEIKQIHQTHG